MLSLHRNSGLEHPWFARPVGQRFDRPHREHHEFLAVSDESAASTTSTEEYTIYNSYKSCSKRVSENRPRSATDTFGEYLDLPSGMLGPEIHSESLNFSEDLDNSPLIRPPSTYI